jgi:hypothetical protein
VLEMDARTFSSAFVSLFLLPSICIEGSTVFFHALSHDRSKHWDLHLHISLVLTGLGNQMSTTVPFMFKLRPTKLHCVVNGT